MRAILEKYHDNCFHDAAHLMEVQNYLRIMFDEALAEHDARLSGTAVKRKKTLWEEFYGYVSKITPTVTGKAIRNHIRKIIEKEQNHQCCYCRRPLLNNAYAKPIEHILPQDTFVQHTFNILNLSISCVDCNSKKSDSVWTSKEGKFRRTYHYPAPAAFSDMFHPRFHRYDEHVKFFRVHSNMHCISIYTGLTPQGINLCKNLLTHISKLEIFVSANSELKSHIDTIHDQDFQPGSPAALAIKEFQKAFDQATENILEHI
ncbi:HNH endonuclease [Pseudomonas lijiangensis]|uniref:HNH endonuclease n=1 Tax=Pseudomonas lijiangensis TaxID=2995658 RepID=UPI0034D57C12